MLRFWILKTDFEHLRNMSYGIICNLFYSLTLYVEIISNIHNISI